MLANVAPTNKTDQAYVAKYAAFISYSHADGEFGEWLHRRIENYEVPKAIAIPKASRVSHMRLGKVFRDRTDLSAASDLTSEIRRALELSDALIVLCSPRSAQSQYVNEEIRYFKALGKGSRIFAGILSGEPHASMKVGYPADEECFPRALVQAVDHMGALTQLAEPREPLAADFRDGKDGRENGSLKLIAALLNVGLDELIQREQQAQRRRRRSTNMIAASMGVLALIAITGGLFAWNQRDLATEREQVAREELMRSMTNEGRLRMRSDPAVALQLALSAFDIWPDKAPVDLLHEAIRRNPPWARVGPTGVQPPRMQLTVPEISTQDVYTVHPDAELILVREGVQQPFGRSSEAADIRLRRIPDGVDLGALKLHRGEQFIAPLDQTSELFATEGAQGIRVFEMSAERFGEPVAQEPEAIDVAFTGGRYPIHFLKPGGQIITVAARGAPSMHSDLKINGAHSILARPDGKEILLLRPGQLQPVEVRDGLLSAGRSLPFGAVPDESIRSGRMLRDSAFNLAWGPRSSQLVIASWSSDKAVLEAVDMASRRRTTLHTGAYHQHGLNRWFFSASSDASKVVIPEDVEDGTASRLIQIDWAPPGHSSVAKARLLKAALLRGAQEGGKTSFPVAAVFAPSGDFLIVAHYLKSLDARGTAVNGVGVLQSWDISALGKTGDLIRHTCHAMQVSLPEESLRSTILQPEAIFDADAREAQSLGTAPLVRVAYSRDSDRVVAADTRGVHHFFRVGTSNDFAQIPQAWSDRLCPPTIRSFGDHGRFVAVRYGDNELKVFDQMRYREYPLDKPVRVVDIVAQGADQLLVIGQNEAGVVGMNGFRRTAQLPFRVEAAVAGDDLVVAYGEAGALVIERSTGAVRGVVVGSLATRFAVELRDKLEPNNSSQLSLARPTVQADNSIVMVVEAGGQAQAWRLAAGSDGYVADAAGAPFPLRLPWKGESWLSTRRIGNPDIIFVNQGDNSGKTSVRQIETLTGREVSLFAAPPGNWPTITMEIESALVNGDKVFVIFRHLKSTSYNNNYSVGIWNRTGGANLFWHDLGRLEDNPPYIRAYGTAGAHALFWADYRKTQGVLVDLLSGERLWEGPLASYGGFFPYFSLVGNAWLPDTSAYFTRISLEVALRGRDYWKEVTTISLSSSQQSSIFRLTQGQ